MPSRFPIVSASLEIFWFKPELNQMSEPLDYTKLKLKKDGAVVDAVRMLGLAVEQFNNRACARGCNAVRDGRAMPLAVEVGLDYRGRCDVLLHNAERAAAVSIGQAIRREIHRAGYGVRGSNIEVRVKDKKVGEHDLELDIVVHNAKTPNGKISVEIKVRRVDNARHRKWLFRNLKEWAWQGSEKSTWWVDHEAHKVDWAGRMLIMVELPPEPADGSDNLSDFTLWPFVRLLGGQWGDGWGLPDAAPPTVITPPQSVAKAKAKAALKHEPAPVTRPKKVHWSTFKKELTWAKWKKQTVAPVKLYLKKKGLPCTNPDRKVKQWLSDAVGRGRAHLFHEVPRHLFGEKQGGWTHAAAEEVLERAYERT